MKRRLIKEYDERRIDDLLDQMYASAHEIHDSGMSKSETIFTVIQTYEPKIKRNLEDLFEFFMIPDLYNPNDREESFGEIVPLLEDGLLEELNEEDLEESRKPRKSFNMLRESFLGNRKRGGFDASKIMRNLKDGRYDDEQVISACVSALEKGQKSSLAQKLVKQLSSDGILAKVYRKSGEFGTKQ